MSANLLPLADLRERMNLGFQPVLVDVRTPAEFARMHAVGARSMPLGKLDAARIAAEYRSPDGHIYIVCHSGARASMACRRLLDAGVADVEIIEGGMEAWETSGMPVIAGNSGAISLERQVRIAAGSFVLLGCLLAWLVKSQFLALAAFVGAGLVFAGITDICGMAILLGKLPWNTRAVVANPDSSSQQTSS